MIGLSGFHSKDYIIAQALSFWTPIRGLGGLFFYAAMVGAGMTAFYMFRLWYMTFAGNPRDGHVYHHAHESPKVMTVPLMILADSGGGVGLEHARGRTSALSRCCEQARPAGIAEGIADGSIWPGVTMPAEHSPHEPRDRVEAEWAAFAMALVGFPAGHGVLRPAQARSRRTSAARSRPFYWFFCHKWWFDELYALLFVRPVLRISGWVAAIDSRASTGWPTVRPGRSRPSHGSTIGSTACSSTAW